jgi:hypothetical protein
MHRQKSNQRLVQISSFSLKKCFTTKIHFLHDVMGFNCAFSGQYNSLMKLKLCGNCYTCFRPRDDQNTVVGRSGDENASAKKQPAIGSNLFFLFEEVFHN